MRTVLRGIGAAAIPELIVVNKIDTADPVAVDRLLALHAGSVAVSALEGTGKERLAEAILEMLAHGSVEMELLIPYERGDRLDELHRIGEVFKQQHEADGTRVAARVPLAEQHRFAGFRTAD